MFISLTIRRFCGGVAPVIAGLIMLTSCGAPQLIAQPTFPLHTAGQYIVDSNGYRVRLNAFNWYGTESTDYVVSGLHLSLFHYRQARVDRW